MNDHDLRLVGALAFALATCRGALTDIASGGSIVPSRAQEILNGTSTANIANAIGCEDFEFDWNEVLTAEMLAAIRGEKLTEDAG